MGREQSPIDDVRACGPVHHLQLHHQRLPLTGDFRQAGEDVVARQADGGKTDHYMMSIGLNALVLHGSPREAQGIWHCWTPAGSTIFPEEVLRYTVLEVFI